ncbi:MAG: EAL domain-containing protein [Oscillospiraceae bacterium]|nr:EAL domain-containing protein [Oscillospiraceae bacterium]
MLAVAPDFVINVNLSYSQPEKADFVDMGILEETDYPPEHLCLEITERCRLLDLNLLRNISLRGRGVRIALDDFGTGFSSIGFVKNLPFD